METESFQISRDCQALYFTAVTKDRLPVFRTSKINTITCTALDEARRSGGFFIFAYVLMPDHLHILTSQPNTPSDVMRRVKGISARRVIDYLKTNNYGTSLAKLRHQKRKKTHIYSLWQEEKNAFSIFSEAVFMEKVNYIHNNPVRAGLVERAIDYLWSSARIWKKCARADEPLLVDVDRIKWRRRA